MSNVVPFRQRECVVIDSGYVRSRLEDQHGLHPWSERRFEYWVEWLASDGSADIVWSGVDYADALRAADEWNLPVVDKTGRMH